MACSADCVGSVPPASLAWPQPTIVRAATAKRSGDKGERIGTSLVRCRWPDRTMELSRARPLCGADRLPPRLAPNVLSALGSTFDRRGDDFELISVRTAFSGCGGRLRWPDPAQSEPGHC